MVFLTILTARGSVERGHPESTCVGHLESKNLFKGSFPVLSSMRVRKPCVPFRGACADGMVSLCLFQVNVLAPSESHSIS